MTSRALFIATALLLPVALSAQHFLTPDVLTKREATDAWPTYHGDYSGKQYSILDQINASTVAALQLAWQFKTVANASFNCRGGTLWTAHCSTRIPRF